MSNVVAITGISGYLGTRLVHLLEKDPAIQKVVGIDLKPPQGTFSKLEFYRQDINVPLDQILKINDVTVMIHLVFLVDPIHDSRLMEKINVGGTRNVLSACEKAGVCRILMASSGTAYGAHADNPEFLKEKDTLRGNKDYQYARDKVLMEEVCEAYQKKHSESDIIIFRPAVIMGPHVNNFISRYMLKPLVFGIRGYDPYMQFVHEDDIADIFYRFIRQGRGGAYNVAPDDRLKFSEVAKRFGRNLVYLPSSVIYPLTDFAWHGRMSFLTEAPSSLLNFIRYPWVLNNEKLKSEIGFTYRYSTEQALMDYIKTLKKQTCCSKKESYGIEDDHYTHKTT